MDTTNASATLNELTTKYSPYLSEIRKKLIAIVVVFLVTGFMGFFFYEQIIRFLINILSLKGVNIVFTSPFQFINLSINCGIATGLIFAFPLIVNQILAFLKPALRKKEYKTVMSFLPFVFILFLAGFLFGFFIMKWQIEIFLAKSISLGIGNVLDISKLLSIVFLTSALMGFGFQFPIIMLALIKLRIIKPHQIQKKRLWVYLGSLFFAILLPADSIIADILLALPLIILFELILIGSYLFLKKTPEQTPIMSI